MALLSLLVVVLFSVLPVALIVALVVVLTRKGEDAVDWSIVTDPVLHRWRLAGLLVSALAIVLAVVTAVVVASVDDLGRGLLVAPLVFALVHAVGVGLTQLLLARWRGRAGGVREASLETRSAGTYSSGRRVALAATGVVALAGLSAFGWILGQPDDMGRPGRSLRYSGPGYTGASGPWPGSFYVVPVLILAAVLVVVTLVALRLVADRPRPRAVDDATLAVDDVLRSTAAGRLLAGLAVGTLGSASGIAVSATGLFSGVPDGGRIVGLPVNTSVVAWVLLVVMLVVVALACTSLVLMAIPARHRRGSRA